MTLNTPEYTYVKGFIKLKDSRNGNECIFHVSEICSIQKGIIYEGSADKAIRIKGQGTITDCIFHPPDKNFIAFLMEKMQMWAEKKERG